MKKHHAMIVAGLLLVSLAACGEEDKLRQRVQDLENERNTMQTEMDQLRKDNDDLKKQVEEMKAEKEAMMAPAMTDTSANPTAGSMPQGRAAKPAASATATGANKPAPATRPGH